MARSWTDEDLTQAVKNSKNFTTVLGILGLRAAGGNHKLIKGHVNRLKLSISHFEKVKPPSPISLTNDIVFVENNKRNNEKVRKFILKNNIIEYKCEECGNTGTHNGKKLTLQLDHKNGIHSDGRLENLRFLCPNCHSQTPSYAKRNFGNYKHISEGNNIELICDRCQKLFKKNISRYKHLKNKGRTKFYCSHACTHPIKIDRELVIKEYEQLKSYLGVAKKLGVSDRTVKEIVMKCKV